MSVGYSTNLQLVEPVTGSEAGNWGYDINYGTTDYIDIAIAGTNNLTTDADVTLSQTVGTTSGNNITGTTAQYMQLLCSGARTAIRYINAPNLSKMYVVNNSTTGGYSLVIRGVTGPTTGVSVSNGEKCIVYWSSVVSDFVKIASINGSATYTTITSGNFIANESITGALSAGAYSYGTLSYSDTNIFSSFSTSVNSYAQSVLQNTNSGYAASTDFIVSNNSGTATTYFGDFGINSSGFGLFSGTGSISNGSTGAGTTLNIATVVSGGIQVGSLLTGTGITAGTYVTSLGTGTGGVGTYTVNNSIYTGASNISITATGGSAISLANNTFLTATSGDLAIGTTTNNAIHFVVNSSITDAMTLTNAGYLGIGTSIPTDPLNVFTSATGTTAGSNVVSRFSSNGSGYDANITLGDNVNASVRLGYLSGNMYFWTNAAERMRIDLSGNLGLGVTPSAWTTSGYPALQLKSGGAFWSTSANGTVYSQNTYFNGTNQIYLTTNPATYYQQYNGTHIWQYAASGTAGNTASFTQGLILDNNGNLGLGVTPISSNIYAASKFFFIGQASTLTGRSSINFTSLNTNVYEYVTTSAATFINSSSAAAQYYQYLGAHYWQTSTNTPSANSSITWNTAMTLDNSGNLLVGITSATGSNKLQVSTDASIHGLTVGLGAGSVSTNTVVGASALAANTSGVQNTAFGNLALTNNTSSSGNTGLGYGSLNVNDGGNYNTAVGRSSLGSNISGNNNVAIGYQALVLNTASNNTAVGYQASYSNQTSSQITAFGYKALYTNTTANNSAFGHQALYSNTGTSNNAFGTNTMYNNSSGNYNSAFGDGALQNNTTANNSTAVGYQSLYTSNRTADTNGSNTAIGFQCGYGTTTGQFNTFVGIQAGYYVTTGGKNTILGGYSGNQGGLDIRTSNNVVVLSDGDGNVVGGFGFYPNGAGAYAVDSNARLTVGNGTTRNDNAGSLLLSGNAASGRGPYINGFANGSESWAIGSYSAIVSGTNQYFTCQNTSGGVYLNGASATSWTGVSDETRKVIIEDITDGLNKVSTLRTVIGRLKTDDNTVRRPYLIAQDVQKVLPEAVSESEDKEGPVLGLSYTEVIPLLVAAIKELKAEFDTYKATHP